MNDVFVNVNTVVCIYFLRFTHILPRVADIGSVGLNFIGVDQRFSHLCIIDVIFLDQIIAMLYRNLLRAAPNCNKQPRNGNPNGPGG